MNFPFSELVDLPESQWIGKNGGHPRNTTLNTLTIQCTTVGEGKQGAEHYRCAMPGCEQSWRGMRQAAHVYNHVLTECGFADDETKDKIQAVSAKLSLKHQLDEAAEEEGVVVKAAKAAGKSKRKKSVSQK